MFMLQNLQTNGQKQKSGVPNNEKRQWSTSMSFIYPKLHWIAFPVLCTVKKLFTHCHRIRRWSWTHML